MVRVTLNGIFRCLVRLWTHCRSLLSTGMLQRSLGLRLVLGRILTQVSAIHLAVGVVVARRVRPVVVAAV